MTYTCPMHPEIEQDHPGVCPICGMTLEPKTIGVGDEEEHEIKSISRKFWIALVLTIPVLILAMGHAVPGLHIDAIVPRQIGKWIEFGLTTPVVLWAGGLDQKSTRLNSSHPSISYAVFCLKKKK